MSDDLIERLAKRMHETWIEVKKKQGFHHPKECKDFVLGYHDCPKCGGAVILDSAEHKVYCQNCLYTLIQTTYEIQYGTIDGKRIRLTPCPECHPDIDTPWDNLPDSQKELNRAGARAMLAELVAETRNYNDDERGGFWINIEKELFERVKVDSPQESGSRATDAKAVDEARASEVGK